MEVNHPSDFVLVIEDEDTIPKEVETSEVKVPTVSPEESVKTSTKDEN